MFVKTIGDKGSPIMLVGEAPGVEEDRDGVPFIGQAGKTLNFLLQQAGISRSACVITNVARRRPPNNEIRHYFQDKNMTLPTEQLQEWITLLKQEIITYAPNVIVALGATAQYILTGEKGITNFRGFIQRCILASDFKVISTYHPQAVNHEYKLHFTVIMDLRKALRHSESPQIKPDPRRLHATVSLHEFIQYIQELSKFDITAPPLAVDIETCQPNSHIHIMGIADSPTNAYSFEILRAHKALLSRENEFLLWKNLDILFQKRRLVMHNGSYDATVLMQNNGIYCKNFVIDTLVAAHVCWPECPRSLSYLSSICLDVPAWKHTSSLTPTLYNAADAANTLGIWEVMQNEILRKGLVEIFNFEMSQLEPAMMLQLQGLKVNEDVRSALKTKSSSRIAELETELEDAIGKKVNFNSPKQLQQLLYFDLELPIQYKRRKSADEDRKMSADAESIRKLWLKTHNPILEKIMELKKLIKLVTGFLNIQTSPQGTVHTCYNVTGATMSRDNKGLTVDDEGAYKSFGRWSSSKSIILPYGSGNLMNIPKKARKMYTAPPEKVLLQADYKQAEAVVVAHLTGDSRLKRMFYAAFGKSNEYCKTHNYDVHKHTAAVMFKKDVGDITPDERGIGKTIRHAVSYSAGPAVISARLDISLRDAKLLLQAYHNVNPHLQIWQLRIQEELRNTRTLTNLFGRKHYFLSRWGDDLFRSAYSFMPQSTVGDLLNKALVTIYYNYPELDIVIQLHDAIYLFVPENEVLLYAKKVKEAMLIPLSHKGEDFIIDVDFSVGKSWGEMDEFDIYKEEDSAV
jgi:uracil-DNA glycosylase family 4